MYTINVPIGRSTLTVSAPTFPEVLIAAAPLNLIAQRLPADCVIEGRIGTDGNTYLEAKRLMPTKQGKRWAVRKISQAQDKDKTPYVDLDEPWTIYDKERDVTFVQFQGFLTDEARAAGWDDDALKNWLPAERAANKKLTLPDGRQVTKKAMWVPRA